jgi:hypothetical protein
MTSGQVATIWIGWPDANSHRPALSECWWIIVSRIQLGKLVYPMSGNLMFFEKINEDYGLRLSILGIKIGRRTLAKSAGSDHLFLHGWVRYSTGRSIETTDV